MMVAIMYDDSISCLYIDAASPKTRHRLSMSDHHNIVPSRDDF